jgi:tetratricopeptide (TPR) repeat protein
MISGASLISSTIVVDGGKKTDPGKATVVAVSSDQLEETLASALANMDSQTSEQLTDRLHCVGEMLSNLAERHIRRGENARAEVLYLRAIQVFRSALPNNHPLTALARDNLAGLYKARRQYALAESLQRTALADLRQYYRQSHADIAITMCNLADTCMLTGRLQDARVLFAQGIEMARELFGPDDPRITELLECFERSLHPGAAAEEEPA